jgi:RHS repeat-associated protein
VESVNKKKFTTYERDSESGLDYVMARFYGNTRGIFLSSDQGSPVLYNPSSLNRYTYVLSDPINVADSDGNQPVYFASEGPIPFPICSAQNSAWACYNVFGFPVMMPNQSGTGATREQFIKAQQRMTQAGETIKKRFNEGGFSDDCNKTLSAMGTSMDALISQMGKSSILDGTNSNELVSNLLKNNAELTQAILHDIGAELPIGITVRNWFLFGDVAAMADLKGNRIFIDSDAILRSTDSWVGATYIHELIHNVTGKWDQELQGNLGLPRSLDTANITQRIKDDCFK